MKNENHSVSNYPISRFGRRVQGCAIASISASTSTIPLIDLQVLYRQSTERPSAVRGCRYNSSFGSRCWWCCWYLLFTPMGCCGVAVAIAASRIARNTTIIFPSVSQNRSTSTTGIYALFTMIRFNLIRSPSYNNGSNNGSIAYATLQLCALLYHHNNSVPVSQQNNRRCLRRLSSTLTIIRSQSHSKQLYSPSTVYHHNYSVAVSQQRIIRRLRCLLSTLTIIRSHSRHNQPHDVYAVYHLPPQ